VERPMTVCSCRFALVKRVSLPPPCQKAPDSLSGAGMLPATHVRQPELQVCMDLWSSGS